MTHPEFIIVLPGLGDIGGTLYLHVALGNDLHLPGIDVILETQWWHKEKKNCSDCNKK